MSELDLDALERRYPIECEYANLTDTELRALIHRLREAEAENERRQAVLLRIDKELQQKPSEAQIQTLERYLQQLERVREAAITHAATDPVRDMGAFIETRINLRAALAAVGELSWR